MTDEDKALFEYWMQRLTLAVERLMRAEQQGLRVRSAKVQLRRINKVEWEECIQLIVRRLDQAPEGMTAKELAEYIKKAGYERMSKNLAAPNKGRKSPLAELVAAKLVLTTRDAPKHKVNSFEPSKYGARRFWTRQWYLRKFATLPDDWQQAFVEEGLNPVDSATSDD